MLPALVAPNDEKVLCVAVAASPLLLVLGAFSIAALAGRAPMLALAQFIGLLVALAVALRALAGWLRWLEARPKSA